MSLQVWLPLNENLNNQGLSNITVTNNGATIDNSGKIGKCYSFNGTSSYLSLPADTLNGYKDISISFWANFLNWNTNYQTVFSATGTSASWAQEIVTIQRRSNEHKLIFTIADQSSAVQSSCYSNELALNTWYHITATYTKGNVKIYQDGNLITSLNTSIEPKYSAIQLVQIGRSHGSYYNNMKLNDFRIYNHCLSQKEVKELSKGLCLHYKLAGPGQENLLKNTYLGTSIANQCVWVKGSNVTISNGVYNYADVSTLTWHSIGCNPLNLFSFYDGKTVTVSYDVRADATDTSSGNKNIVLEICPSSINSANRYNDKYVTYGSPPVTTDWQHVTHTIAINSTIFKNGTASLPDLSDKCLSFRLYRYNLKGCQIKNFKVEFGSVDTPWCPNSADALYVAMGYNNNIEYDCSGYGYNGIKNGTIEAVSDTPRYLTSYKFNSSSSIVGPVLKPSQLTMAYWVKGTCQCGNWEGGGAGLYYSLGFIWEVYINGKYNAVKENVATPTSQWNHIVGTYDNRYLKLYVNGALAGTVDLENTYPVSYHNTAPWAINGNPNRDGTSITSQQAGNISDFRLYATALSAEDVLELYHTSAMIDNTGNGFAYEFMEV